MLRILCVCCLCFLAKASAKPEGEIWLLDIKGAIGVATAEYLISGIDAAHASPLSSRPKLLIIQMDTPGGLDGSMRQIIQRILSSAIPVVGYVAPRGARAASAGTYILYAVHIAAMSPATTLGAATPIQLGGVQPQGDNKKDDNSAMPANAIERKLVNDAAAYIDGLADLRGRNRNWAVKAVRSAASLSAQEALNLGVINLVADDINQLLVQLDGMQVSIKGQDITLDLTDHTIVHYGANWRHQFLAILTDPNIAYLLMLAGAYGLFFEFSNPGFGAPGIIGALCILLSLYAFQLLPVNYAGVGIILLGLGLMIAEAMLPSFGTLGIGGVIAFIIGSVILIDTPQPAFQIAMPLIVALGISSALFIFMTMSMVLSNRRQKPVSGVEPMVGQIAEVEAIYKLQPMIRLQGELWQVNSDAPLRVGDRVKVTSVEGLKLNVIKHSEKTDG